MPFQNVLDLLIQPPGNLIYHLVLAFSIVSALQAAWIGRQAAAIQNMRRLVFGLVMLLVAQVLLFFSSGLAWQKLLDERIFLPPLDRAVVLFSLVWIVWLWNFARPARLGDLVTGFLSLGVVVLFFFTYNSWSTQPSDAVFNTSWIDWTWEYAMLFVVLIGIVLLIFSRPPGWEYGFAMLILSLAGIALHLALIEPQEGLSGYIRLGQLAAFPLLSTLVRRYAVVERAAAPAFVPAQLEPVSAAGAPAYTHERRRYSSSVRTVHAWLELNAATEPEQTISGMAKAVAYTMLSDLCFIINGPNYGHIVLQSGYDLIREEEIQGTMLEQSQLPMISNALQRSKPQRVTDADPQPADMKALSAALGLKETGSMMFLPLTLDGKPQGGLLFLSPYSNRQWSPEDQNYLSSEMDLIARQLRRAQQAEGLGAQIGEDLHDELENLRKENQRLLAEVGEVRQGMQPIQPAPEMDLNGLVALQQEAQDQIQSLQAENERLQAALKELGISVLSPEEFTRLEAELRSTLQEIAQLQNQLAEANARNLMLERELRGKGYEPNEDREVIISIVQEIRQPMSSIIGYTDLMLAETVGILGALQRKFLERVRASTERMRAMLDDLVRVTALNEGPIELLPEPVELSAIIDGAVSDSSAQLREKNIALQVDLPDETPQIYADRDAIHQIILHLLQNASGVTPQEGTITLRARTQTEDGSEYLLLQVSDTGGGVQQEDLPRVFARRYRADMPLIEGIGDTGVGLSIARTLVEAHGGRIWADSVAGESTTFSVLLPIRAKTAEQ